MGIDISPLKIAQYDQRSAQMAQLLDRVVAGYKLDIARDGETIAAFALADAIGHLLEHGAAPEITDLLVTAIARMAK